LTEDRTLTVITNRKQSEPIYRKP